MAPKRKMMAIVPILAQYTLGQSGSGIPGASSYVAPAGYPTTAFSSYYPVPSGQEPQPALYDPILDRFVHRKICYMRSGSTALGLACPYGYGSVQAAFEPS